MSIFSSVICGLWIGFAKTFLGYWAMTPFMNPLFIGIVLGGLLGDWKAGAAIGVAIQPMYLVNYGIGGVVPTALVICSGMSLEAAEKLYADDPEEKAVRMERYSQAYITNYDLGSLLHCALLSMEEQRTINCES